VKNYKVVRWKKGKFYTPTHIAYRHFSQSLCKRIYSFAFEFGVVTYNVLIDNVDCAECVNIFTGLASEEYGKNKNPIVLRMGI